MRASKIKNSGFHQKDIEAILKFSKHKDTDYSSVFLKLNSRMDASWISDLIKIGLPGTMVCAVVYWILKNKNQKDWNQMILDGRQKSSSEKFALKIQAFERLTMMCERIQPLALYLRLYSEGQTVNAISKTMIIAVQQEFDHNLSQQLYVSSGVWKLIKQAKDLTIEMIAKAGEEFSGTNDPSPFLARLESFLDQGFTPLENAKTALVEEFKVVLES